MAPKNEAVPEDSESEFTMIDGAYQARGGPTRDDAGATCWRSGLIKLNAGGNDEAVTVAGEAGVALENLAFRLGVDLAGGTVAAFPEKVEPGKQLVVVRRDTQFTFHIGAIFRKYPQLRPISKRIQCPVIARTDKKGDPYLLIALSSGSPKITVKRDSGGSATATAK